MLPPLPQELLDMILDNVDKGSLPHCALVASNFRHTVQKALFTSLRTNSDELLRLELFLAENDHLASSVRCLSIEDSIRPGRWAEEYARVGTLCTLELHLLDVLTSTPSLVELRLITPLRAQSQPFSSGFIQRWCRDNVFLALQHLELSGVHFSAPRDLAGLLRSITTLQSAVLWCCACGARNLDINQILPPLSPVDPASRVNLRSLDVSGPCRAVFETLAETMNPQSLDTLSTSNSWAHLILASESSLNITHLHLEVDVTYIPGPCICPTYRSSPEVGRGTIDLSAYPRLQSISLRISGIFDMERVAGILRYPPPALRRLQVESVLPPAERLPELFEATLERVFASPAYTSLAIESVKVLFRGWDGVEREGLVAYVAELPTRTPSLCARGVLEVVFTSREEQTTLYPVS
ncbi:hypothetical protein MKEN_00276000 [Mycena kentingensis (nom. inval.)]|nr:hypothetical protein MKEN_00276000 [Mycena kentingensis (nom. inval.)]